MKQYMVVGHPTDKEEEQGIGRVEKINSLDELMETLKYFKNDLHEKHVHLECREVDKSGIGISLISSVVITFEKNQFPFNVGLD